MWHLFFIIAQIALSFYIITTLYLLFVNFIKSKSAKNTTSSETGKLFENHIAVVFNDYCSEENLLLQIQALNHQGYSNYSAYFFVEEPIVIYNALENIRVIRPLQKKYTSFGLLNFVKNYIPNNPDAVLVLKSTSKIKEGALSVLNQSIQNGYEAVQCQLKVENQNERMSAYQNLSFTLFNLIDRQAMQSSGLSAALWSRGFMLNYNLFCTLNFESYKQNDKALQAELLQKSIRIAYESEAEIIEQALTEEEFKLSKSRTYHLYAYNFKLGFKLLLDGLLNPSFNKLVYGFNYLRPPLIIMLLASVGLAFMDWNMQVTFTPFFVLALIGVAFSLAFLFKTSSMNQLFHPLFLSLKIIFNKLVKKRTPIRTQNQPFSTKEKLSQG